jgi:two-component system cell cycle response regulator
MARILVIEDNLANLELMTYLLSAFGHTPLTACDGQEGWEAALRNLPDIILCDIQLPKLDGFEVARRLKSHSTLKTTSLVAVTALAMVGDRDRMLSAGFDGYISKPIVPETFVSQVEAFLDDTLRAMVMPDSHTALPSKATRPFTRNATILVIDDTPANLELILSIFEPFGYSVLIAQNIHQGIAIAQQHRPDLIISDWHMPGLNGFDLIQSIRADPNLQSAKIIIHSATVVPDIDHRRALEIGADQFIKQPIEPQFFLDTIVECLQKE